ncbi:PTS glucitol/sorbitol transporter subunit IIA [Conservatibacter flavescens]|uniref:PTS sorbitol transporter subunit IIA n=1 Tax=Conservatibacter flavescens TaxID=28161 RepID=A0A2M8S204_9PAST|nr:PTS glucitol/sorbitol transporter subunit IIA [Conservatibacter flavescens]PJG85138.1 PTS sorbitol transporter subunit IIA [Conservatibacter flavescens]
MKYYSEITEWGEEALMFLEDESLNFIILFNHGAPEELKEVAVLHSKSEVLSPLVAGDTLYFGDKQFEITAVGEEAQRTFKELGHCTLCFNGESEAKMPGYINVKGNEKISAADIYVGCQIKII